jgi:hypothetical protein
MENVYKYQNATLADRKLVTCGHRGIGVTFDADNLEKVEYVRIVLIKKYILSFCFYQVLLKIQLMH